MVPQLQKFKIDAYDIELTVLENRKMVVINPSAWTHAAQKY